MCVRSLRAVDHGNRGGTLRVTLATLPDTFGAPAMAIKRRKCGLLPSGTTLIEIETRKSITLIPKYESSTERTSSGDAHALGEDSFFLFSLIN